MRRRSQWSAVSGWSEVGGVLCTAVEINNIQLWDIKTVLRNVLSSGALPAGDEAGDGGGDDEHRKSHSLWECEFYGNVSFVNACSRLLKYQITEESVWKVP